MLIPGQLRVRGPEDAHEVVAGKDRCWLCEKVLFCTLAVLFYGSPAAGQLAN